MYRLQVIRRAAADLELRLEILSGEDVEAVWSAVTARLRRYLDGHGVGPVVLHRSAEPPMQHPRSGKYAQVIDLWNALERDLPREAAEVRRILGAG